MRGRWVGELVCGTVIVPVTVSKCSKIKGISNNSILGYQCDTNLQDLLL